jgi:hypothetical protein
MCFIDDYFQDDMDIIPLAENKPPIVIESKNQRYDAASTADPKSNPRKEPSDEDVMTILSDIRSSLNIIIFLQVAAIFAGILFQSPY